MPDCRAEIRIHDDRWGIFTDRCRLEEGHEGDHRTPRTACEPVAYLGWAEPEHNDGSPCPIQGPHDCDRSEHESRP